MVRRVVEPRPRPRSRPALDRLAAPSPSRRDRLPPFRFGPHLAAEANRWLAIADAPIRLDGTDAIPTELWFLGGTEAKGDLGE